MKKIKQTAIFLMKLSVSAILLSLLIAKAGPDKIIGLFRMINSLSFIAALLCYVAIIFVSALRLRLLIHCVLPLKPVFAISAIGVFFNMFLPSGISGDVARAYYLNREMDTAKKSSTMDLVAPLLMERYFGLGAVLIIGLAALPFAIYIFERSRLINAVIAFAVLLAIFFFTGMTIFQFRFFNNNRFVSNFYSYLDLFKEKKYLFAVFLYSAMIQVISICAVFLISEGMGLGVSLFYFVVIIPIINIMTILPITLGGIGLREGAFVMLLASQGIPPYEAISLSLLSFISAVIASLMGFYEYMRYRAKSSMHISDCDNA